MALTTRGTAKDGSLTFTILAEGAVVSTYAVIRGGYTVKGRSYEMAEQWYIQVFRGATLLRTLDYGYSGTQYTVGLIDNVFKIYEGTTLVDTFIDVSPITTSGVWQTEDSTVDFGAFENLDGASTFPVTITSGGNGTVSKSSVNVTGTIADMFVATPATGYALASLDVSAGVTATPAPDGNLGAKTITVKATQAGTLKANFAPYVPPADDPAWWTTATPTDWPPTIEGFAYKTQLDASETVGPGEYFFGDSTSIKHIWPTYSGSFRLTDDGYALVGPGPFILPWMSFDKTLSHEVEVEFFTTDSYIDAALVCYSSETHYHHAAAFDPDISWMNTAGSLYHDYSTWTPPRPTKAQCVGKWIKWGYEYYSQFNAATGKTEAFTIGKITVDGVTSVSTPRLFTADVTQIVNPVANPSTWVGVTPPNLIAFRNFKIIGGHAASWGAGLARYSNIKSIIYNGQRMSYVTGKSWQYETPDTSIVIYAAADFTERIEGSGTVELPLVTIPEGLLPKTLNFRSNQIKWKIVDDAGATLLSGQTASADAVTSINISSITSRTIRPIFTLDPALNATPTLYWADFSWDYSINSATAVTATVMPGGDIHATWTDNADNNDGYNVERSVDGGAWTAVATLGDVEACFDTETPPPVGWTTVQYRVAPYNAYGTGQWATSNVLSNAQPANVALSSDESATVTASVLLSASVSFADDSQVSVSLVGDVVLSASIAFGDSSSVGVSAKVATPTHAFDVRLLADVVTPPAQITAALTATATGAQYTAQPHAVHDTASIISNERWMIAE